MLPYYALVILTFLLCLFDFVQQRYIRWFVFVGHGVLLVLFVGLRSLGVDNDGFSYQDAFNLAGGMSWTDLFTGNYPENMERGYLLVNKVIYSLGGNIHIVFMLMAVTTGLVNYTLIFRRSPYPFTSLLIYVCFFYFYRDFTQIRFALSAGIGLWAIFMFVDRKYIKFFLLVLLASTFHSAALVVLLPALIYMVLRNQLVFLFLPLLGLIGGLFNPTMLLFQLGGLPPILAHYVEVDEIGKGGYVISIIAQVFLIGMVVFREKLSQHYSDRLLKILFISLSLSSFINLLFISFAIMQRLSLLLFGTILFAAPYLCRTLEMNQREQFAALSLRFLFLVYVFYYGLKMISPDLMQPYSIW
ncbi:EpsG family protein [Parapedobacter tibetensis]|uniref:EpsG family protein n=1 Tax=Parapedobacter tibetensis TaxID=2972951 RepID=UPI00214D7FB3|nr:EpsG family protein [Parapedobacter tibetensis]